MYPTKRCRVYTNSETILHYGKLLHYCNAILLFAGPA